MKIVDAYWTRRGNILRIECDCGSTCEHRADRWWVTCAACKRKENLANIRRSFVNEQGKKVADES